MFDYSLVMLDKLAVHQVGSRSQDEGFRLSKEALKLEEDFIRELLLKYFLSPFKSEVYYNFTHESDLSLNEVYTFASRIFADRGAFYLQSLNITKHLYEQSNHPKIRGGEFYVAYFTGCQIDGETVDAIGLFKSENKDTYLRVFQRDENFEINYEDGININKLDKGCLIFNTEEENGYKVCIVDNLNRNGEAQYWKDDFLKLKARQDSYHHTQSYMRMTKGFIADVFDGNEQTDKADQIDLMNRTQKFFSKNETFNEEEFTTEVIKHPELITAFKDFKEEYEADNEESFRTEFSISGSAVKGNKKIFKSILKLDKNFSVYIHGNRDYVIKGFDEENGLNYYQLYFKEER